MSKKTRINTKELVERIEKVTREKLTQESVISLDDYRKLKKRKDPKTILIIDDDETIRQVLRRILEADGYRVLTAADGTQLSSVLDDSPIELIILDIGLPWINGFELAELIKESPDLNPIPLVFISARTSEADVRRAFELGGSDYVKKPFDMEHIRKTVNTLLAINS
jgi:two-component system aerobic respiration control protein ArcA